MNGTKRFVHVTDRRCLLDMGLQDRKWDGGGGLEDAVDGGLLLRGEGIGRIASLPCSLPVSAIVGGANELDRRQDHQNCPKQRHPTAGEKGGEADAEHGKAGKS